MAVLYKNAHSASKAVGYDKLQLKQERGWTLIKHMK